MLVKPNEQKAKKKGKRNKHVKTSSLSLIEFNTYVFVASASHLMPKIPRSVSEDIYTEKHNT